MLVDEMILELNRRRRSMESQMSAICNIMDKSNSVFLQIENCCVRATSNAPDTTINTNTELCNYRKETVQALAQIIEQFPPTKSGGIVCGDTENELQMQEFVQNYKQRVEFAQSSARKLLALNNIATQMKVDLQNEQQNFDEECSPLDISDE